MTNATLSEQRAVSSVVSFPLQRGLRAVPYSAGSALETTLPSLPCLVLKSAIGDKNIVNDAALLDLFESLLAGERIELSLIHI